MKMYLRQFILDTASETEGVDTLEENLKWGEPGNLTKGGQHCQNQLEGQDAGSVRCLIKLQHISA